MAPRTVNIAADVAAIAFAVMIHCQACFIAAHSDHLARLAFGLDEQRGQPEVNARSLLAVGHRLAIASQNRSVTSSRKSATSSPLASATSLASICSACRMVS